MASVTVTMPGSAATIFGTGIYWEPGFGNYLPLGGDFSGGVDVYLGLIQLRHSTGEVRFQLADSQTLAENTPSTGFSDQMEQNGSITLVASDGSTLTLSGIDDASEPYSWIPSNSAEVITFTSTVEGLTDRSLTVTFNDNADIAPSFSDDTGDAQAWTKDTEIAPVTVPAATGTPAPTYAAVGTLPAGIAFNTTTRVISGTPTAVSSGTIRIRATNSAGTADWTVSFTTTAEVTPIMAYVNPTDVTAGEADDIAVYQRVVDNMRALFQISEGITVTLYSADKVLVGDGSGDGSIESFTVPNGHILIGGASGVLDTLAPSTTDGDMLTSRNGDIAWETP